LDLPGAAKEKTRFQFGLSFSFDNWDVIDIPDYLDRNRSRRMR